jgi:polycystin 1L2
LTINDYWNWLEESFVSNIRAQQWYNGDSPRNLSGFINDKTNRFIGWATMRQLRIKSSLCSYQKIRSICLDDYSLFNEEKSSFPPGWINETIEEYSSSIVNAFEYKSSNELNTYVYVGDYGSYSGNGYVYEFRGRLSDLESNLSQLHQLEWIDNQTRAVIIQLSLYNPNVDLFTSVILLAEFLSTGGVFTSAQFEPMNFYGILYIFSFILLRILI